jgi:formate dehydrogenase assembly factor FdhD
MERGIMPIEVRYIMFTPEETRHAVVAFALKEGYAGTPDDILALNISGGTHEVVSVNLEIRGPTKNKAIKIASERLVSALLLYCNGHKIPIPRRAQKMFESSSDGITMVLTTDLMQKQPVVVGDHITYTGIANYAQETREARRALALAIARSESAEAMVTQANAKTQAAESAAAALAEQLAAIRLEPGLRGRLGRWLMYRTLRN